MISFSPVSADDHYDYNDIGDPNDVQAQEMQAVWDSTYEYTRITWRNIGGDGGTEGGISSSTIQNLPLVKYRVYRASQPINASDITDGNFVVVSTKIKKENPSIASLIDVFPGANWHEREAFEMFGISFEGHPNLVKLYLPDGFEGNPLLKSYELLTREVKPWPGEVDVEPMPESEESEKEE